jgi:hypothetical protein
VLYGNHGSNHLYCKENIIQYRYHNGNSLFASDVNFICSFRSSCITARIRIILPTFRFCNLMTELTGTFCFKCCFWVNPVSTFFHWRTHSKHLLLSKYSTHHRFLDE